MGEKINSISIEKVANGYIMYINNVRISPEQAFSGDRYVFSSTEDLNKFIKEFFNLDKKD